MNFLPQDYKAPKSNGAYMKLQDGENRFRILSQAVIGWEDWENNKPIRFRLDNMPKKPIDPKKPIKHFWSFIVWDYSDEQIKILHLTQATIRKSIETLCTDQDWGAPYGYDIKISKKGEGKMTEYHVNPCPHKKIAQIVIDSFNERKCNLEALFDNQDPFSAGWDTYTQGVFESIPVQNKVEKMPSNKEVSTEEIDELIEITADCPEEFRTKITKFLEDNKLKSMYELPMAAYKKIKKAALEQRLPRNMLGFLTTSCSTQNEGVPF